MQIHTDQDAIATPEEFLWACGQLTDTEKRYLRATAAAMLEGTAFDQPADLFNEAVYRTIEGSRRWPKAVALSLYLKMTMRSIAFADRKKMDNRSQAFDAISNESDWLATRGGMPISPSAEDDASAREEAAHWRRVVGEVSAYLEANDPVARLILGGILDDMTQGMMLRAFGLEFAQFKAARQRILRRLSNSARL